MSDYGCTKCRCGHTSRHMSGPVDVGLRAPSRGSCVRGAGSVGGSAQAHRHDLRLRRPTTGRRWRSWHAAIRQLDRRRCSGDEGLSSIRLVGITRTCGVRAVRTRRCRTRWLRSSRLGGPPHGRPRRPVRPRRPRHCRERSRQPPSSGATVRRRRRSSPAHGRSALQGTRGRR